MYLKSKPALARKAFSHPVKATKKLGKAFGSMAGALAKKSPAKIGSGAGMLLKKFKGKSGY